MELISVIDLRKVVELMDIGLAGYVVLFGLLFACGLGLTLPEDIPLLTAGMLVGAGKMNLAVAGVCAWCGIIGGDCVLYYLSHRYGLRITTKIPLLKKHVTSERIQRTELLFARWGIWVVAIGRLFAGVRGVMVIAAGTIRYSFLKFIVADGLAALVSGGLFMWLGYVAGKNLDAISNAVHSWGTWVFIVLAGAVVLWVVWRQWRKRTHLRTASELAVDTIEKAVDTITHQQPLPPASGDKTE